MKILTVAFALCGATGFLLGCLSMESSGFSVQCLRSGAVFFWVGCLFNFLRTCGGDK